MKLQVTSSSFGEVTIPFCHFSATLARLLFYSIGTIDISKVFTLVAKDIELLNQIFRLNGTYGVSGWCYEMEPISGEKWLVQSVRLSYSLATGLLILCFDTQRFNRLGNSFNVT